MQQHPFIFSNERRYRIRRHLVFWIFWAVFQGFLYAFVPVPSPDGYLHRIPQTMLDSVLYLPSHVLLSYSFMYFVIPAYVVKGRYLSAALWSSGLILLAASLSALVSLYLVVPAREALLPQQYIVYVPKPGADKGLFYMAMLAGLRGGLTVSGMAAAIKLMKHWYTEGQRNLQLKKEAAEAQLQVLKAQVHPHFLFNTLNNIYSLTQKTSPDASRMVMDLSDMLRYMLYECNQPLVPLSKELAMIEEYIGLEKIRYGNKLDLHVDVPRHTNDLYLAPLLLLPFVENGFKHGISNVFDQPWMNLFVTVQDKIMTAKIVNSKAPAANPAEPQGIGIDNVRRRLELLYPNKHELVIENEEDVFVVCLKLELEKRTLQGVPGSRRPANLTNA